MFSSLGLFKHVQCPKQDDCALPACIFSHVKQKQSDVETDEYDPFDISYVSAHPAKRLKTAHEAIIMEKALPPPTMVPFANKGPQERLKVSTVPHPSQPSTPKHPDTVHRTSPKVSNSATQVSKPTTVTRPISPSPIKFDLKKLEPLNKELLVPRKVPSQPVTFQKRHSILQLFHTAIQSKDKMSAGGDPKWKAQLLSEQELIKYALDCEEEAARKYDGNVYQSHLGTQMIKSKKMTAAEWRMFVKEIIRGEVEKPVEVPRALAQRPTTGLGSLEEESTVLRAIRTSVAGLEQFGYVTSPPSIDEIAAAKAGVETAAGFEHCDRCGSRFRVTPGRDEDGRLASEGSCQYHWARVSRPPTQKTDRMTGSGEASHPCCGQLPGSKGCTEAETHVFVVKDVKRMASIWQFETTPVNPNAVKTPVSFDCEMGYTTLGMEVIRLTAVSWPEGKELLDVLVRCYGEVLDLNTRFSGVSQKQFATAQAYATADGDDEQDGEFKSKGLQKVESPAMARQLLFDLIGPETPLIGHAIENDLNTLRIIHPIIVDTVLLYPHQKGLPIKYGLKFLTRQHLDRVIQNSGAAGHDSKEDAIATGDLVTLKVREKWREMEAAGWRFEDGKLVAPVSCMANAAL